MTSCGVYCSIAECQHSKVLYLQPAFTRPSLRSRSTVTNPLNYRNATSSLERLMKCNAVEALAGVSIRTTALKYLGHELSFRRQIVLHRLIADDRLVVCLLIYQFINHLAGCQLTCPHGYQRESATGCARCECRDPCLDAVQCSRTQQICVVRPVVCDDPSNCPPQPACPSFTSYF